MTPIDFLTKIETEGGPAEAFCRYGLKVPESAPVRLHYAVLSLTEAHAELESALDEYAEDNGIDREEIEV